MKRRIVLLAAASLLVSVTAFADDDDPPGRAARLSYVSGSVSFQPGSVEDWVPATLNRPMTTGDRLWTEGGARAEMNIGSAAVRLNGRTNFAFLNLDDRTTQIQLSVGTVSVRVRRLAEDEIFEIDTPQLALTVLRPGDYRVDVDEQGDTSIVSVRGGEAEANAGTQAVTVHPRDQLRVTGTDQPVLDTRTVPPADAFDNFCQDRDRREDLSPSGRYVSRDMPGYQDLDGAGTWSDVPDYGMVWVPRVEAGWAPYHFGHWAWIAPWGWTWVDDEPWGYAPFHYGRWVFVGGGWGWVPGPVVARPVYAPALVAWVGGGNFGVGIGIGVGPAVGWFPLGPREVWVPSYHYSPAYIERVNVTNTVIVNRTVINNVNVSNVNYMNRRVAGAVTVVPQSAMTTGRPVAASSVRIAPDVAARAQVGATAGVAPERSAVLGARVQAAAAPPAAAMNRQVVARQRPPAPEPSFAQQQTQLRQNPGQPIPRSSFPQAQQRGAPAAGGAPPAVSSRPTFRQVGPPAGASTPQAIQPRQPFSQPPAPQATPAPQTPARQQPEFRRQPEPQATPPPQTPARQQPEFRRQPAQPAPQPAPPAAPANPQPEVRRGGPPQQHDAPARDNQKQRGRTDKQDGKRGDRN